MFTCLASIAPNFATDSAWSPLARLLVKDVGPRGSTKCRVTRAAERSGSRHLFPRARMQPVAPIKPPASLPLLGRSQKRIRCIRIDRSDHEGRFRIGWRIEKALQVSTVRKHEGGALAHDLGRLVDAFPWRDVVGDAGDHV